MGIVAGVGIMVVGLVGGVGFLANLVFRAVEFTDACQVRNYECYGAE